MWERAPRVVLICHADDPIDRDCLARWLASTFDLVGIVLLHETPGRLLRTARRHLRRLGPVGFLDILAFRAYYRLCAATNDATWLAVETERLRASYDANMEAVPQHLATNPNSSEARRFIAGLRPNLVIARCKFILTPDVFNIPSHGTFALHPGICPEYRNAHGCFWALTRRDLGRIGMTLLKIDRGIDTGPVFFQGTYPFDERRESHVVIQYRVVLENLDGIAKALLAVWHGEACPIPTDGRPSAVWGQPSLTAFLRWRRLARRGRTV